MKILQCESVLKWTLCTAQYIASLCLSHLLSPLIIWIRPQVLGLSLDLAPLSLHIKIPISIQKITFCPPCNAHCQHSLSITTCQLGTNGGMHNNKCNF